MSELLDEFQGKEISIRTFDQDTLKEIEYGTGILEQFNHDLILKSHDTQSVRSIFEKYDWINIDLSLEMIKNVDKENCYIFNHL